MRKQVALIRPIVFLLIFWGLAGQGSLWSQGPNFVQFSVEDGLPPSIVYGSFEDQNGYMWFATEFGVSRYDGYKFLNLTTDDGLSDNVIFDFFEDSRGRIWFYTYNGVPCYYFNGEVVK